MQRGYSAVAMTGYEYDSRIDSTQRQERKKSISNLKMASTNVIFIISNEDLFQPNRENFCEFRFIFLMSSSIEVCFIMSD